ncbi:response regulator transcription factor [Paenibacillus thalictri]|uniref:Response regulator transcription factor n=1 Tax=Paenibacillus thalictri TaxID=2527873 RepID=A0A4Q9E099_9BACL|nr:response regulator transcription factor [Paenibacillus thalictri]TBL81553.1 response regulator transcription factor [Paenibacillus thalictri]
MADERILLVEDDQEIRELIRLYLRSGGFQVISAVSGEEGLRLLEEEKPELVLLDIYLPGIDGFEVCKAIRKMSNVPIIFISCRKDSDDIVQGLELGGDDYIVKPFDPVVVVARVQANLRRAPIFHRAWQAEKKAEHKRKLISFEGLEIDLTQFCVFVNKDQVTLSAKEMQLLVFLAQNPNQVFTAEELYRAIWGVESNSDTRTVLVHISSIRRKIEANPQFPRYIQNIRGIGYKFNSSGAAEN